MLLAWLCAKGRHDKAKRALRRLVGNVEGYEMDREYSVLSHEVAKSNELTEASAKTPWRALFTKINFKRAVISCLPFTAQNFVGTPLMYVRSYAPGVADLSASGIRLTFSNWPI